MYCIYSTYIVCVVYTVNSDCIIPIETVSLLAHGDSDVVSHSSVDSINTEAAQQQQLLKGWQILRISNGEWSLFWSVEVIPLMRKRMRVKLSTDTFKFLKWFLSLWWLTDFQSVEFFSKSSGREPNCSGKSSASLTMSSQLWSGSQPQGFLRLLFSRDRLPNTHEVER